MSSLSGGFGLTAIDPGADAGFASFEGGRLFACGLLHHLADYPMPLLRADVVIELPQIYRTGKARPQDMITLAVRVGEVKGMIERAGGKVRLAWPHEWKGSIGKGIMGKRILSRLYDVELEVLNRVVCPAGKRHNILDACGLGLFVLGRL